jgi:D-glycero-D-manno-heptose 1,7-bisphosphate phosphatase
VHKIKEAAIFFDRDGVLIEAPLINKKPTSVQSLKDVKLCKNILEICKYYKKNYYLIMITNQPDYSRGVNSKKNIININNFLKKKLNLDMIYVCYSDNEKCIDRKPNPGMLLKAKKKYKINLKKSFMIGDRWRDIGAGNKAGCATIFIDRNYSEKMRYKPKYSVIKLKEIFSIIK